jgi:hypothetical protein
MMFQVQMVRPDYCVTTGRPQFNKDGFFHGHAPADSDLEEFLVDKMGG